MDDLIGQDNKMSEAVSPTVARRSYDLGYDEADEEYAGELSKLYRTSLRVLTPESDNDG